MLYRTQNEESVDGVFGHEESEHGEHDHSAHNRSIANNEQRLVDDHEGSHNDGGTDSSLDAIDIDGRVQSLTSGASQLGSGVVGTVDRVADGVGGAIDGAANLAFGDDEMEDVVKVMILFPALIAALNALKIDAITAPAMDTLNKITGMVPGFIAGALTVGIAYFIGKLISELVTDLLAGTGVNTWPEKLGIAGKEGSEINVAGLVGKFILVTTVFFAVVQTLPMMGLDALGGYANEFVSFAAPLLVGLVVVGGGFVLTNFVGRTINESGIENSSTLSNVAKIGIMVLSAAMGLQRMGLATSIVNLAFGLILGALALAAGIAFGWGGRDAAKKICDRYVS